MLDLSKEGPHKSTWQRVGSLAAARTLAENWGLAAAFPYCADDGEVEYAAVCAAHFGRMYLRMRKRKQLS